MRFADFALSGLEGCFVQTRGDALRACPWLSQSRAFGLEVLYPNFIALLIFTALLVGVSAWRFRKQLN